MSSPAAGRPEKWETVLPGLRKKVAPFIPGPWFQYRDAVGFEWNTFELDLPDLPAALNGFRILHLSDLHCQPFWQTAYDELLDRLAAHEPDIILITGDIVDFILNPEKCLPVARRFLQALRAPRGVIGIRGNHDEFVEPGDFNGTPLRLLDGQRTLIIHNNSMIELIAAPGPMRQHYTPGFENQFPPKSSGIPRIIISHYPDHIRKMRSLQADLFLCGHTHGGQICLPGRWPIIRHDSLPMKYFHGAHRFEKTWFFISRGLGFSTHPLRIFCPAEVTEIRLGRSAECKLQKCKMKRAISLFIHPSSFIPHHSSFGLSAHHRKMRHFRPG